MPSRPANTIATLTICYESVTGELTQRGVSVTDFDDDEMVGFCHLREQTRTFLFERIISCADAKTGQHISDANAYLQEIYKQLPRYSADLLYRNHYEILQVLLYVGKADGQLRSEERKVIAAACKVITGDVRITEDIANDLIDSVDLPGLHGFKVAVGKVAKHGDPAMMRRLLIACKTIVKTQKHVTATEQEALDYMAKRFNLKAE